MNPEQASAFTILQWLALGSAFGGLLAFVVAIVVAVFKGKAWLTALIDARIALAKQADATISAAAVVAQFVAFLESRPGRELIEGIAAAGNRGYFDTVIGRFDRVAGSIEDLVALVKRHDDKLEKHSEVLAEQGAELRVLRRGAS